jgi:hypothetical protein
MIQRLSIGLHCSAVHVKIGSKRILCFCVLSDELDLNLRQYRWCRVQVERLSVITDGIGLGIDNKSWTVN